MSVKDIGTFLAMAGYYRRFVTDFAKIAAPLNQLTRKGIKFTCSHDPESAFRQLKLQLCKTPVLAYPDFTKPFRLKTDASDTALGAILSQVQNGLERPLAYVSRQLNTAESNDGVLKMRHSE
jgi:hypothetical protein